MYRGSWKDMPVAVKVMHAGAFQVRQILMHHMSHP